MTSGEISTLHSGHFPAPIRQYKFPIFFIIIWQVCPQILRLPGLGLFAFCRAHQVMDGADHETRGLPKLGWPYHIPWGRGRDDATDKAMDTYLINFFRCNEDYLTPKPQELLAGDAAIAQPLRRELKTLFHESAMELVRFDRWEFTDKWISLWGMARFDETLPKLPRRYFQSKGLIRVQDYFNKHLAVYFQSTFDDGTGRLPGLASELVGRYLFQHWFRMHGGRPPFQRGHYLAKAIEFVCPSGLEDSTHGLDETTHLVTDLPYIRAFHASLCDSIEAEADDIERPLSNHQQRFGLGHLFRSLFIVVDGCHAEEDESTYDYGHWSSQDYNILLAPEGGVTSGDATSGEKAGRAGERPATKSCW